MAKSIIVDSPGGVYVLDVDARKTAQRAISQSFMIASSALVQSAIGRDAMGG
jgi:hypothetical protein